MARITEREIYNYYDRLMDKIYLAYHQYPTNIPPYSFTAEELAEMSEADATGRELARGLGGGRGHKCTQFHRDPDFCNGLPRRKGR